MATEFQKQKLSYFFHILDLNKNGYIQLEDFLEMVDKVCAIMNYEEGGNERKRLTNKAIRFFNSLVRDIESVDPLQISEKEWVTFFDNEVQKREDMIVEYKEIVFNFMFDFFDHNRDGYISRKEYEDFYRIFNIDKNALDEAFPKLVSRDNFKLHRYDLMDAIEDFFTSDDKEDAGNWVFGNWESDPHL
ncbi:MAG: EF-hand domain-containing protein [Bacteroidota bacterium]